MYHYSFNNVIRAVKPLISISLRLKGLLRLVVLYEVTIVISLSELS